LSSTGYGVIELKNRQTRALGYGAIKPPASLDFFGRLKSIREGLLEVIEEFEPREMAVEDVFYHRNARAALSLGHARGVAIVAGLEGGLDAYQYTALQVKKAIVGYGLADKQQVQKMLKTLLSLEEMPRPDDASDALAIALTHCFWRSL
jgi:crossover junction endodeoxyribonuclease RuvC